MNSLLRQLNEWSDAIQAASAVLSLLLTVVAIWLGLAALQASKESVRLVTDQNEHIAEDVGINKALALGSFPVVVDINGFAEGILLRIADLSESFRYATLRDVELLDENGHRWAVPATPWVIWDRVREQPHGTDRFDGTIPLAGRGTEVAVYFPLSEDKEAELAPGLFGPVTGETSRLPDGVTVWLSWVDPLGAHREPVPTRDFKYAPKRSTDRVLAQDGR